MSLNEIFLLKYNKEGHLFASRKETAFLCILSSGSKTVNKGLTVSRKNTFYLNTYLNQEGSSLAPRPHSQNWLLRQKQTNMFLHF